MCSSCGGMQMWDCRKRGSHRDYDLKSGLAVLLERAEDRMREGFMGSRRKDKERSGEKTEHPRRKGRTACK